jgi:hypothetical protein
MNANPITDALRANVANAKSKAGRKLAENELARWLARKRRIRITHRRSRGLWPT